MVLWRIFNLAFLKYLLALTLVLPIVVACSSGGGAGSTNSNFDNVFGLSWVAPSQREDGTALALSEISGYRIYYGTETGNYRNHLDVVYDSAVQEQIADIPPGDYYVVVTTIDTDGRESEYSTEVIVTI